MTVIAASLGVAGTVVVSSGSASAAAAGSIDSPVLTPTTLANGYTGTLCFGWTFPVGTDETSLNTVTADPDFTMSMPAAFPAGQTIYSGSGVPLAFVDASGGSVTIHRLADSSWGEITSTEPVCVDFTYTGDIAPNEQRSTTWGAQSGPGFQIPIIGADFVPAWYGPSKSGTFFYSATGEPMI